MQARSRTRTGGDTRSSSSIAISASSSICRPSAHGAMRSDRLSSSRQIAEPTITGTSRDAKVPNQRLQMTFSSTSILCARLPSDILSCTPCRRYEPRVIANQPSAFFSTASVPLSHSPHICYHSHLPPHRHPNALLSYHHPIHTSSLSSSHTPTSIPPPLHSSPPHPHPLSLLLGPVLN